MNSARPSGTLSIYSFQFYVLVKVVQTLPFAIKTVILSILLTTWYKGHLLVVVVVVCFHDLMFCLISQLTSTGVTYFTVHIIKIDVF